MNGTLDLKVVYFNSDGDGVTALYVNNTLNKYGDYYHDKIDDNIEGMKDGLELAGVSFKLQSFTCNDDKETVESVCEMGESPEEDFNNVKIDKK